MKLQPKQTKLNQLTWLRIHKKNEHLEPEAVVTIIHNDQPESDSEAIEEEPLDTEAPLDLLDEPVIQEIIDRGHTTSDEVQEISDSLLLHLGHEASDIIALLRAHGVEIEDDEEVAYVASKPRPSVGESRYSQDPFQQFLNNAGQYKLLTAAEEVMLAKRIERGDKSAKSLMINSNLRLVVSIAKRYQGSYGLTLGDLVQEGIVGLNRAVEKYDWRKGYKFSTYATWWIRQAVQRGIANQGNEIRLPVHVVERRQKIKKIIREHKAANEGREPSVEEIALLAHLPLHHVEEALSAAYTSGSLNEKVGEEDDGERGDLFADPTQDTAEEALDNATRDTILEIAFNSNLLNIRQKVILSLRYGIYSDKLSDYVMANGQLYDDAFNVAEADNARSENKPHSYESIGQVLGINRGLVRELESQALRKLAHSNEIASLTT